VVWVQGVDDGSRGAEGWTEGYGALNDTGASTQDGVCGRPNLGCIARQMVHGRNMLASPRAGEHEGIRNTLSR